MKSNPDHHTGNCQGYQTPAPRICCMPKQTHGDDCKAHRHYELNGPYGDSGNEQFTTLFFSLNQVNRRNTKENRDAGCECATENASEELPSPFQKIGQRGKRKKTLIARGKHSAEQADDEHHML